MQTPFNIDENYTVTEANINFYSSPFVHPRRKMAEHDFIYLVDGKWKIGQNDEIYELNKDSLLILSANNTHYGVSPCAKNTKTMYFHVSSINDISDYFLLDSLIDVSLNKNVKKLFSETVNAKLLKNQKKANLYFKLLLLELFEHQKYASFGTIPVQIKKIIHDNPEKFFSNEELAKMVKVSKKIAEIKFKEAFNLSIHKYMLEFKVKQAISYFEVFPEMSIKEVAFNLGFYDEYHFSNQFKKITGVPPKKYKTNLLSK